MVGAECRDVKRSEERHDFGLKGQAVHHGFSIRDIYVKFAPNPKLSRQVDSRLDRKARSRQETTTVLSFQVVDIGSVTMDFLTDRVAGSMNEEVAVACGVNRITADIIDFPAAGESACQPPDLGQTTGRHRVRAERVQKSCAAWLGLASRYSLSR